MPSSKKPNGTPTGNAMANNQTLELRKRINPIRVGSFLRKVIGWNSEDLSAIERGRWSDLEQLFWEEVR